MDEDCPDFVLDRNARGSPAVRGYGRDPMDLAAATRHFLQGGWKARALASIRALEEGWLLTRLTVERPAVNHSPAEIHCDLVVEAAPSSGTGIIALTIVRPTTESISSRPPI
jgi:hypothetical protein